MEATFRSQSRRELVRSKTSGIAAYEVENLWEHTAIPASGAGLAVVERSICWPTDLADALSGPKDTIALL